MQFSMYIVFFFRLLSGMLWTNRLYIKNVLTVRGARAKPPVFTAFRRKPYSVRCNAKYQTFKMTDQREHQNF